MMESQILKVIRYCRIYGISRALVKATGRSNFNFSLPNFKSERSISIIGCGQFAFSTIAHFLYFAGRGNFLGCYDVDPRKSKKLARFYGFRKVHSDVGDLIADPSCKLLYIASNHSSHTDYAIRALDKNIDVYIEKPISVNIDQLIKLKSHLRNSKSKIFAGYNRPYSKAINIAASELAGSNAPVSINYFISGHLIPRDHWYRNPKEGTRICGNLGHWLDLTIFLFNKRGYIPSEYQLSVSYASSDEPDDNISISLTTEYFDIVTIFLTSRCEPFEGINETINIQCDKTIIKIDDFRRMAIWKEENIKQYQFHPKDVGHKSAVNQPFNDINQRDFHEIELSTLLMLKIKDMVLSRTRLDFFNLKNAFMELSEKSI